jgi:hypothetical protein
VSISSTNHRIVTLNKNILNSDINIYEKTLNSFTLIQTIIDPKTRGLVTNSKTSLIYTYGTGRVISQIHCC